MASDLTKNAMVAAVTEALNYKMRTGCSDDEALGYVVSNLNKILSKVK